MKVTKSGSCCSKPMVKVGDYFKGSMSGHEYVAVAIPTCGAPSQVGALRLKDNVVLVYSSIEALNGNMCPTNIVKADKVQLCIG